MEWRKIKRDSCFRPLKQLVAKAKQPPDFGDDEFKQMVCVESGNVAQNKITLAPEKSASLKVVLSSQPI